MRKNSLFRRYFSIFSASAILSILVLGIILMLFASQYFQDEKYAMLERNAHQAAAATAANYTRNNYSEIDPTMVTMVYSVLASAVDAEIFFADMEGNIILSAGVSSQQLIHKTVPMEVIERVSQGEYRSAAMLKPLFGQSHYGVGVPVQAEDETIGILFAAASAASLREFISELSKMFLISAIVVLFIFSVVIYIVTIRLIRPLRDMLAATQSFSQGDFSKRVKVSGFDEIGQLAMAFNNMASTLATTELTRRSFVANVSHELKTPMTTISGFVDGMLDGTIPEEKHPQYLQVVSNEVKRLSRLVRSMLDSARIEAGEMHLCLTLFDISELIRQTVFTFEHMIEEKQLEIRGLDIDKIMVRADSDLMHQVVYNLIENAVKFVNPGGCIAFSYHTDAQRTYVSIRNTGAGLDKEEVPHLFERFYKSDRSRSLNKNGAGLGLHIVKSIVNYHKGEIMVRSVKGEFTEFEFCIPSPSPGK